MSVERNMLMVAEKSPNCLNTDVRALGFIMKLCAEFSQWAHMPKVSAFGNQSTDSISALEDLSFQVRQFHAKSSLGRAVLQELELFVAIVFEQGNP